MKALIFNPDLSFGVVPDPVPSPSQVLVQVSAVSLATSGRSPTAPRTRGRATSPGWDAAGGGRPAAADGSGPAVGARVVTFGWSGAWAELRAVDTTELALVPDEVDLALTGRAAGRRGHRPAGGAAARPAAGAQGPGHRGVRRRRQVRRPARGPRGSARDRLRRQPVAGRGTTGAGRGRDRARPCRT
ncbi:hypothetical protein [Nonomuraea dietziae]|uniref:hypothetical protein n=1 Tax=Nonomuraea dietziae TaxID=65515 RepID=UPI0031DE8BFF